MKYLFYIAFYLIGSIPFSYLITLLLTGKDIRKMGSGNVGATNVFRTTGRLPALLALAFDFLKGVLCVWLASRYFGNQSSMALAGLLAMIGHSFPVFLRFQGGKSVATGAGSFLLIAPLAIACTLCVFALSLGIFRIISLGSISAAIAFPVFAWIFGARDGLLLWGSLAAALIVYRHKSNLARLMNGTERRMDEAKSG